jgi:hypothetical protein
VDFTVSVRDEYGSLAGAALSFLTFSLVPGYLSEQRVVDVNLAWRDAEGEKTEHLHYESRIHLVIWFPLVLAPDFIFPGPDFAQVRSRKMENGGFKEMFERLGDDIKSRLGRSGAEYPVSGKGGVACPADD